MGYNVSTQSKGLGMENNNMRIWKSFPKTDENYTKVANEGGRKLTSVTPVYMVKLATEALGPIGEGWGYTILEERFDNTQPILLIEGDKAKGVAPVYMTDNGQIVWEKTHTVVMEMWHGTKENTFIQYGHTKYSYMTKNGKFYVDHEYGKKSVTDAMTKCLSLIGVCSDIYMGEFDDQNYRSVAKLENDLKKAETNDQVYHGKVEELRTHVKEMAVQISMCPTIEAMQKIINVAYGRVYRECPVLNLNPEEEKQALDQAYLVNETKIKGAQQ
uniref:Uncharacterized protein n=1 Tax=uncultured marine virus TaxID=186617 RepID=A0A0F7L149_9VIRU|nr:hypothetical protein F116p19 [uncultured marine virus]